MHSLNAFSQLLLLLPSSQCLCNEMQFGSIDMDAYHTMQYLCHFPIPRIYGIYFYLHLHLFMDRTNAQTSRETWNVLGVPRSCCEHSAYPQRNMIILIITERQFSSECHQTFCCLNFSLCDGITNIICKCVWAHSSAWRKKQVNFLWVFPTISSL